MNPTALISTIILSDFTTMKLFVLFLSQTEIDQVGPIFLLVGTGDTTVILDNRWILLPHLSCHCSGQDNLDKTAKQASDLYQTMPTTIRRLKCKNVKAASFWSDFVFNLLKTQVIVDPSCHCCSQSCNMLTSKTLLNFIKTDKQKDEQMDAHIDGQRYV